MKVSCTKDNLQKGVGIILKAVAPRPTLPILTNILLGTDKGRLKLTATDLEIGITTWIGAKIDQEGSITVPARLMAELVQSLRDETVLIELKDRRLIVKNQRMTAELATQAADEFPIIPTVKKDLLISVAAPLLKEGIRQVIFASAADETRPALTALAIRCDKKEAKLVATDSYRLSEKTLPFTRSINSPLTLLIPARSAYELERLIEPSFDQVEIIASENQCQFHFQSIEIVSRLIDGQYPEYESIIPKESKTTLVAQTVELIDALKTTIIFARESANQVTLSIDQKQPDSITLTAQSTQLGSNMATVLARWQGPDLSITFNAKFMLDILTVMSSERVEIGFNEPTTPLVIRPEKLAGYVAVIMPLKIN